MSVFTWLVIVGLLLLNALYVAAEFAAVSVRRSRLRQAAEEGNTLALRLLPMVEDVHHLDRYIAVSQVGISLTSLILGAFGQATLARDLAPLFRSWGGLQETAAESTAALVVLIGLTVLQVVAGELVPKSLALQYPLQTALYTVLPMRWSLVLYSWFIAVLNGSGLALLRLLGSAGDDHRHIHSPQEIDLLIAESHAGGLLEPQEQQWLSRALKLAVRRARQLMVPRPYVAAVDVDTPLAEILRLAADSPYTRLPVYQGSMDHVIGMLHTKDLVRHYLEHGAISSIQQVMRPVVTVPESLPADRLLAFLREKRTELAIVVDEFGGMDGLVTMEDVLAEILGEVGDEFKVIQNQPEMLPDGRVRLSGLLRLDEAAPWIGVLWQGASDTVGGRIMEAVGRVPEEGERLTIDGVDIEVEWVSNNAVASILATPRAADQAEEDDDG